MKGSCAVMSAISANWRLRRRRRGDTLLAQVEWQDGSGQDVVVVAGSERDAIERAGGGDAAEHVEGAVVVELRDLDRHDIVDLSKTPPEIHTENDAADRRLQ